MAEGSIWGSIFNAILGGVSASADSKDKKAMSAADIKLTGEEERKGIAAKGEEERKTALQNDREGRKTTSYASSLEDYYKQRDRKEKRDALGNYGTFGNIKRFAPNYDGSKFTPIQPGGLPNPITYGNDANYAGLEAQALANQSNYKRS